VTLRTPYVINDLAVEELKLSIWPEKTLLIPKSGASTFLNHRALLGKPSYVSSHLATVIADPEILDPEYLYYWSQIIDSKHLTNDNNYPSLRLSEIGAAKIPIPPLETQRRIVAILDKAEKTRRLRAQADMLARSLIQSVFLEMFGDPARNPMGWKKLKLGEILGESPQNGLYKPENAYGDGAPILRIDSFYDGKISNINQLKRLKCTKEEIRKFKLEIGDILINRVNSLEYLGKCGLVQALTEDTIYESNMMRIRVRTDIINPVFLTRFLCSQYTKNQILSCSKKAVNQASINQSDVESLNILLPPIQLQDKFAKIFGFIENLQRGQRQSHQNIENILGSLLQKAFCGELVA
jgi:type I restriction enzyme S subunit